MHTAEVEWLQRAIKGDDISFARLVEAYQKPVYNLCYRMLGNANDAEDAAQETFLRVYKALHRYDPKRKFSTWLLSIASNYCIDQHRRRKLPTFSYDALETPDIPEKMPSIEGRMVNSEQEQAIAGLLETLKPKDRSAVVMHYWYDYSYEEIADALSLTVSAVKSRLHRARRALAEDWLELQQNSIAVESKAYEQYESSAV